MCPQLSCRRIDGYTGGWLRGGDFIRPASWNRTGLWQRMLFGRWGRGELLLKSVPKDEQRLKSVPMDEQLRELRGLERKMGLLNEGEMACCQITMAQCHTLVEIGRVSGGCPGITLNALAARLNLDSSTMSRTVQNLVVSGLVRREPDPEDRRAVMIALTPEGERQYGQIEEGMKRQYQSVLERIPKQRHAQVMESLALVLEAMSACCEVPEFEGADDTEG